MFTGNHEGVPNFFFSFSSLHHLTIVYPSILLTAAKEKKKKRIELLRKACKKASKPRNTLA